MKNESWKEKNGENSKENENEEEIRRNENEKIAKAKRNSKNINESGMWSKSWRTNAMGENENRQ